MPVPKIVFLDQDTIPAHIALPTLSVEHQWQSYPATSRDQVVERLQGAKVAIVNKVVLDEALLSQLPDLTMIAVAATGYNNVDIAACQAMGITVCNIRGYATRSVPEHVIAMLLALKRNLKGYHQDIAKGVWQQGGHFCFFTHPIQDMAGSTLGIIGSGELGQATANLVKALGVNVVFAERKGAKHCRQGFLPFEQVLSMADAISLHCPLNEDTHHLIGEDELALMPKHSILINAGRGGLVDEHALVSALKQQHIAGAGMDVFTQEPAPSDHVLLAHQALPNLLLTPHVAWGSDSAIAKLTGILFDNIDAFLSGTPQNVVV
ncbi:MULTISPECIES: D-2-hydroxyacid dehydrogenase [unclassified Vibrio]|uniref:D-2-hydroxyacid dehydrogenase n=1 Tax=Vibrio sp. HB236076 TaxID=3232307 RepID=A0AB39HFN1_9VIBR|nr:D-2-hydroxyacid dehydrogenase [Vibrio sp. HB161653]MDP5254395.1 D-2-hydroxyacid dehydrogenase [Vibrio sp. HB161653]